MSATIIPAELVRGSIAATKIFCAFGLKILKPAMKKRGAGAPHVQR